MSVDGRNAIHLRRDAERRVDEAIVFPPAENLSRLRLDLLLLAAADVRNHVIEYCVGRDAGVSRAGDGLHRRDMELLDAVQALDRGDGQGESDGRAIRIGDARSASAATFALTLDRGD